MLEHATSRALSLIVPLEHMPLEQVLMGRRRSHRASPGFPASESAGSNRTISSVMLSRAPPSFACASSFVAATSGNGLRLERGRDRLVR
jgi:hypothetical protein